MHQNITLLGMLGSPPDCTNNDTTSVWPSFDAKINGVSQSLTKQKKMYEIANKHINHEKELPYYQCWDLLQPVLIGIQF